MGKRLSGAEMGKTRSGRRLSWSDEASLPLVEPNPDAEAAQEPAGPAEKGVLMVDFGILGMGNLYCIDARLPEGLTAEVRSAEGDGGSTPSLYLTLERNDEDHQ